MIAASRQARIDAATEVLRQATGRAPAWAWFVPGRLEVFGKHTDYAGGRSLVAATSRGFGVVAAPRGQTGVRHVSDPSLTPPPHIAVVVERLARDFPGAAFGVDFAFSSDLPRAAGLSSSSAIIIGTAMALIERAGLTKRPEWIDAIRSPLDLAGYFAAIESGARFGPFPGAAGVGTHGGSEDHIAILAGRADHLSAYRYAPVTALGDVLLPATWTFVIATSGVAAEKTGGARELYNRASMQTRTLLDVWNRHHPPAPTLAAALASADGAVDELLALASRAPAGALELTNRLRHFVREDARVPLAVDAFRAADADALGTLAAESQADADQLLGNQVEETRVLARLARDCGAVAASSFGAGFGGSVWALIESTEDTKDTKDTKGAEAAEFERRWTSAYGRAMPGRVIESFVTRPAAGLAAWPVC